MQDLIISFFNFPHFILLLFYMMFLFIKIWSRIFFHGRDLNFNDKPLIQEITLLNKIILIVLGVFSLINLIIKGFF